MSQENVEIVRRINEASNRGDRDAMFAYYHPDLEWRDLQHAPDAPERLQGIGTVGAYLEQWKDAFDDFTAEIGVGRRRRVRPDDYALAWEGQGQRPCYRPAHCPRGRDCRRQDRAHHHGLFDKDEALRAQRLEE